MSPLSREVPRLPVAFVLQSCGASLVGWQGEHSPIVESDERITHHVLDRPITGKRREAETMKLYAHSLLFYSTITCNFKCSSL